MNRTAVSIFAVSAAIAAAAPAMAQSPGSETGSRTVCARGADERIIEIVSPGEVGARCDVRYTRDGGANVRIPYHANNSADFCAEKAAELVSELRAAGFQCDVNASSGAPALRGAAEEAPASDFVIETQRGAAPVEAGAAETGSADAGAVETAPAQDPAPVEEGAEDTPPAEDEGTLQEEASLQEPVQDPVQEIAQPSPDDELAALMSEILSQPVSETLEQPVETAAVRGPANLTEDVSDEMIDAAPMEQPVGRLAGADPMTDETPEPVTAALDQTPLEQTAPEPVVPITQAAVTETPLEALPEPAPSETAAATAPAPQPEATASAAPQPSEPRPEPQSQPQAQPQPQLVRQASIEAPAPVVTSSGVPTLLRRPADIVRATVRAQAAAWNEGNLDAFMDVYARDDNLVYVSGDEVTRGWSAARKRYRDRYDGPAAMGRIDFEKLDAELVTEDVAIVTGRVRHAIGEEISKAVFSIVMKRDQGVWRIVHDHTAPAATASQ